MILSYSIISSVILGCCYLAYRFFMAGQQQHALNRGILLLIYALSLTLPFAVLAVILHHPISTTGVSTIEIGDIASGQLGNQSEPGIIGNIGFMSLLYKIYIAGAVAIALYFLFGIAMLWRIIHKGERTEFENFSLILVDDTFKISPFSCHKSIVMRRSDFEEDGDMILMHEYGHLKLNHWSDLVLAYFTICLQWYNPAAWAMREELKAIHEYQADESVVDSGIDTKEYQMLLVKRAVGSGYQSFANSLNHSKLKKRVTMMYKEKTSLRRRLFALALIPAIGAGIAVTSIPAVAGALESLATVSEATASSTTEKVKPAEDKEIYKSVEVLPEFPGGLEALLNYLSRNIRYPEEAHNANEQGKVVVKFVVDKDGTVCDAEILKGVSESLDKEAIRVVESMPKWTPGTVKGQPVDCFFTLPINFKLEDNTPKEN